MFKQFKFEEPLYRGLERIPLSTAYKLEMLGLDFPLDAWGGIPLSERWVFCHLPIRSRGERDCYIGYLAHVLKREGRAPSPPRAPKSRPWEDIARLPAEVAKRMGELDLPLFWPEWIKLDDLERYAIFKLCRDGSDPGLVRQAVQDALGPTSAATSDR